MLPTAAWLRKLRPDVDLLLQLDPEGAPWGPKPQDWMIDRVVAAGRTARDLGAEVVVLPCNTASVTALEHVRAAASATAARTPAISPRSTASASPWQATPVTFASPPNRAIRSAW